MKLRYRRTNQSLDHVYSLVPHVEHAVKDIHVVFRGPLVCQNIQSDVRARSAYSSAEIN